MEKDIKADKKGHRPENGILIKVAAPMGVYSTHISSSETVDDLIKKIVSVQKLTGLDDYELYDMDGIKLKSPDSQISSFNFPDGIKLNLVVRGRVV